MLFPGVGPILLRHPLHLERAHRAGVNHAQDAQAVLNARPDIFGVRVVGNPDAAGDWSVGKWRVRLSIVKERIRLLDGDATLCVTTDDLRDGFHRLGR